MAETEKQIKTISVDVVPGITLDEIISITQAKA